MADYTPMNIHTVQAPFIAQRTTRKVLEHYTTNKYAMQKKG